MKNQVFILFIIVSTVFSACSQQKRSSRDKTETSTAIAASGPDAIIYKTKANYNTLVPVTLNEEKTKIVSFPAPGDLIYKGKPALPTLLADSFLLDNRGINQNVAFLNITYGEYMALEKTPAAEDLMDMILDDEPLLVMYNCGKRQKFKNEVRELNALILENELGKFNKLK